MTLSHFVMIQFECTTIECAEYTCKHFVTGTRLIHRISPCIWSHNIIILNWGRGSLLNLYHVNDINVDIAVPLRSSLCQQLIVCFSNWCSTHCIYLRAMFTTGTARSAQKCIYSIPTFDSLVTAHSLIPKPTNVPVSVFERD